MAQVIPQASSIALRVPGPQMVTPVEIAVIRVAPDARLLDVNETACLWLGYSREQLRTMRVMDINPQVTEAFWREHWARLLEHQCLVYESMHARRDGTTFPVQITTMHMAAPGDEFAMTVVQDRSERVRTRRELEAMAARLNEAQQIALVGNWERDLATQRVTWSAQMFRLFGYEPGAFQPTFDWVLAHAHSDDRDMFCRQVERAIRQIEPCEFNYRILHRGGGWRNMHCRGRVITDPQGRPIVFTGTLQDVTSYVQVQQALQAALDRLNAAQRVAHVGSWDHDLRSGEEIWSEELFHIFGFQPGEVRTSHAFFLDRLHPDDRARVEQELRQAIAGDKPYSSEFRVALPDGTIRECHHLGRVRRDEQGRATHMYGTCQDVTDHRVAEQALRRSEEHYRRAAETNRRLLAEVNHRVRNNLTGLLSLLRITQDESRDTRQFCDLLRHRITAMTKAHNLLAGAQWHSLELMAVIRAIAVGYSHIDPDQQPTRVRLCGPAISITPRQVIPLALAMNELFINAVKHGCLGRDEGWLEVIWRVEGGRIEIDWREYAGPPILQSIKPSLGTELIRGFIDFELRGRIEMTYPRDGAHHTLRLPIEPADPPVLP